MWKRKRDPKGQRPLPPSVLHSRGAGRVTASPLACALKHTIPDGLSLAARSSRAGVWLRVSAKGLLLPGDLRTVLPKHAGRYARPGYEPVNSGEHCLSLFHMPEWEVHT